MINFYQHLPEMVNPVAFSLGNFAVRWYSIMYLIGFLVVYLLLIYRMRSDKNINQIFNFQFSIFEQIQNSLIIDFIIYSFIGLLIGARLGYVLFYNFNYFIHNPLAIISPFDFQGNFVGIFGMSYFGGLMGIILATWIFCRRNKIDIWKWSDFVIPVIPAGYFFGRIGNFLNGELYGKITDSQWGMFFPADAYHLRYPTQLVEALFEGLFLFAILWLLRNSSSNTFGNSKKCEGEIRNMEDEPKFAGQLFSIYLIGYGLIRFLVEFLRETDKSQFLGVLNISQFMALGIIAIGLVFRFRKF